MLHAYVSQSPGLARLGQQSPTDPRPDLGRAIWIDLYRPLDSQSAAVEALGLEVPTLADMEEIEISNRLYREDGTDVMTVVIPGHTPDGVQVAGPVSFILTPERLVTVRHHAPRSFITYPDRAARTTPGCATPERIFLGLVEEIVARLADLLEGVGRVLDAVSARVLGDAGPEELKASLGEVGRQGDLLGKIRLALLTLERALSFFDQTRAAQGAAHELRPIIKALMRDIAALSVHNDFLSSRVSLSVDATLGMINLAQNNTVRILSVVTALFLPPTLIASAYGMNFANMPELNQSWGYPFALVLMVASAAGTWAFFKWKKWL
ncbi:magnesium transporter [Rhodobacter aestuarii]|uniref:Magnesium transport protein CorA n=1 Tax=Rhodobacter aestuarii TaxID=453582 RepID=A0A1N7NMU5_9RHOB|nr:MULTISPECIES: magnesium transporter CorA family protein [Rhodobacter]PTV94671.1 magnesium transporter [Rhodobacter aestuarii]SIS99676.1 magnesium transporter [Rhodobacter aestuarii]SOC13131.1 magnesium transporter [Rhodobacter sp. JA431]